ncbi:MAG: hypothetical protein MJ076_05150 [Clostridia bacterium]|nr:hypothetical protein [Clostridia bacterium]
MLQNLKVDIIYYLTGTDFEMEFNLCGCCRMRLLTDKTEEQSGFVKMLSRAVQRSRIIIACGSLFSPTGLISMAARLIGQPLETVNNDEYGINSTEKIEIIKGSTPLITPDGYFGGCIIESGPQSIILLSESKTVRKTIMQNLIHQYITDISMLQEESPVVAEEVGESALTEDEEIIIEEDVILEENAVSNETAEEENVDELQIEKTEDETPVTPENDLEITVNEQPKEQSEKPKLISPEETGLFIEPEKVKYSKKNYYDNEYYHTEADEDFYFDAENNFTEKRNFKIPIIIICVLLGLIVLALAYYLLIIPIVSGRNISEYFQNICEAKTNLPKNF